MVYRYIIKIELTITFSSAPHPRTNFVTAASGSSEKVAVEDKKWRCNGYLGMCSIEKCNTDCCINDCIRIFKYQGNVWGQCEEVPGTALRRCRCDFDC